MKLVHGILLSLLVICTGVLVGCQSSAKGPAALDGVTWSLESYTGETGTHQALKNVEVTLVFNSEENRLGGIAGCNEYGAPYEVKKSQLTVKDNIIQTLKLCADEAVMEQEANYLKALQAAENFEVDGDTLTITGGVWKLEFKKR